MNGEHDEIDETTTAGIITASPTSTLASDAEASAAQKEIKKARRQTAFYPNLKSSGKPQKPFSRSAAKRESVMTLGSIEHLQHYFTKAGIQAKQNPFKPNSGAAPAIGGPASMHIRGNPSLSSIIESQLPPSPAAPAFVRPPYPHVEKNYEVDPEQLKPSVIKDLQAVAEAWVLSSKDLNDTPSDKSSDDFDVLSNLMLTTRAIRSVRNYLVSLPDESTVPAAEKEMFRARQFTPAPFKQRVTSNPKTQSDPLSLIRRSALDVLIVLRALEESARLPLSDEAYDAQSDHGSLLDGSSHAHSRGTSPHPAPPSSASSVHDSESERTLVYDADTSVAFSVMPVPGRAEGVPVWADEDDYDPFANEEDNGKREVWEDRLVLGGGWLYKPDIKLKDLDKERAAIGKYLDTVDEALFGGTQDGLRGWERAAKERSKHERESRSKSRRSSGINGEAETGKTSLLQSVNDTLENLSLSNGVGEHAIQEEEEEEEEGSVVDDDDLPDWARRTTFSGDDFGRLQALLIHLIPASLIHLLPSASASRLEVLDALSSGQLLCIAYNAGVRRSRKPWGYINKDAIHDIAAIEAKAAAEEAADGGKDGEAAEKRKTGWTFRRTDNLRLWAGALKLRYMLPLVPPTSGNGVTTPNGGASHSRSTSKEITPTKFKFPKTANSELPLVFEAKIIARKSDGWEDMLEAAVVRWMRRVVDEKRGER